MAGNPPGRPLLSPDGRFYWDGVEWLPVSSMPAGYAPPPQYGPQPYYAPEMPVPVVPVYPVAQPVFVTPVPLRSNGAGTAAGVLGIIAVVLMFVPVVNYLSVLLGILATVLGGVGIRRANREPGLPKGMATTGLVLGIIAIVVSLIFIIGVYAYVFRNTAPWI
jgi:hypothetical protein